MKRTHMGIGPNENEINRAALEKLIKDDRDRAKRDREGFIFKAKVIAMVVLFFYAPDIVQNLSLGAIPIKALIPGYTLAWNEMGTKMGQQKYPEFLIGCVTLEGKRISISTPKGVLTSIITTLGINITARLTLTTVIWRMFGSLFGFTKSTTSDMGDSAINLVQRAVDVISHEVKEENEESSIPNTYSSNSLRDARAKRINYLESSRKR